MSLQLPDLQAYVTNMVVPRATDIIYKNSPVFVRLHTNQMERFTGGLQIQRTIIVGKLLGGAFGRGAAFPLDFVTTESALLVDMKGYGLNITIYRWDGMKNRGAASVFNQVSLKFENAAQRMVEMLATDMYLSAQDPGRSLALNGFAEWFDDGNTYPSVGGQTRNDITPVGTVGGLNSYVASLSGFNLTALNTAYTNAWFGPDHVDLIPSTINGFQLIWQALQPLQRFNDNNSTDLGQVGFANFRFNAGADVVVDRYMPSGFMYGLNTKYIEWYFSDDELFSFGFTGFKGDQRSLDLAGQYVVACNLVCPDPRSSFKISSALF